ncbi:MAG: hypothetical protein EAX95_13010 [Candidatus Thorarchaeota archaeon]|nr:hypothetical protein [Candidatus Thorarchaeota archaeon]
MPGETDEKLYKELMKKVDDLSEEIAGIRKDMAADSSLEALAKKVEDLEGDLSAIKEQLEPVSSIEELTKSVDSISSDIEKLGGAKAIQEMDKKIEAISKVVSQTKSELGEMIDSKEIQVMYKKLDDLLVATADIGTEMESLHVSQTELKDTFTGLTKVEESDTLGKKIDDLQQYVASLSGMEEKMDVMGNSLEETKEIVGIIVRQLDDIERKYKAVADRIEEAVEMIEAMPAVQPDLASGEEAESKKGVKKPPKEKPAIPKGTLPSNIDEIMKNLISQVTPQTEAREMADALEEARDALTTMIKGHTPVLFQFGKRARELKSYPPTALLNENDIAGLNTEIRSWSAKLKEIAKGE